MAIERCKNFAGFRSVQPGFYDMCQPLGKVVDCRGYSDGCIYSGNFAPLREIPLETVTFSKGRELKVINGRVARIGEMAS